MWRLPVRPAIAEVALENVLQVLRRYPRAGICQRQAGIRGPILLMEGFFDAAELPLIVEHDFWVVVAT